MQLGVAPDGCRHDRENDVIDCRSAMLPNFVDFRERHLRPNIFLWSLAGYVESQSFGWRQQLGKIACDFSARLAFVSGQKLLNDGQQISLRGKRSFDKIRPGTHQPVGQGCDWIMSSWRLEADSAFWQ